MTLAKAMERVAECERDEPRGALPFAHGLAVL